MLALLPAAEGQGLGKSLLQRMMLDLRAQGHQRLFLSCASDPASRSHGFYRHLGWRSTGQIDAHGDEVLEHLDSRVLVRGPDGGLQIVHEHLSRLPKAAESAKP